MNIWLERFVLVFLATLAGATVLTNPWQLDGVQQPTLIVAVVALSLFTARTIERSRVGSNPDLLIEFDEATDLWKPNGDQQVRAHVRVRNPNIARSLDDVTLRVANIDILHLCDGDEVRVDEVRDRILKLLDVPLMKREQAWSLTSPPIEAWLVHGGDTMSFEVFNVERAGSLNIVQARSNSVANRQGTFYVQVNNPLPPG